MTEKEKELAAAFLFFLQAAAKMKEVAKKPS